MPFSMKNIPDIIKKLPKKAQEIWIKAFNSAFKSNGGNEPASSIAGWGAVKNVGYSKDSSSGKWTKAAKSTESNAYIKDFPELIKLVAADVSPVGNKENVENKEITEANELTLYQKRDLVEIAVEDRFGQHSWPFDIFDTYVIVRVRKNNYSYNEEAIFLKVDYTFSDNFKSVILAADTTPVEKKTEYIPIEETEINAEILTEAKKKDGSVYKVRLIKAGLSKNNFNYPAEVLRAAVPLFEGVRAIARSDEEHCADTNFNVQNIVGWYSNPQFEDNSVVADLNISAAAEKMKVMIKDAWDRGKKDLVQLSIVALGTGKSEQNSDGSSFVNVESLKVIKSVDTIVNAAAGGEFLAMRAATNPNVEENSEMLKELLKLLESKFPEYFKKIKDPKSVEEVTGLLSEAVDNAKKAAIDNAGTDGNSGASKIPVSEGNDAGVKEGELILSEARLEMKTEMDALKEEARVNRVALKQSSCKLTLTEALSASKLPVPVLDGIRNRFDGKVFEKSELDEEIVSQTNIIAKLSESGNVTGFGGNLVEVGQEHRDKVLRAFDGFFLEEDVEKVPRFKSIKEAYLTITGDVGFTGDIREATNLHKYTEALDSTSWTQILGDSITRRMVKEYGRPMYNTWRKIVSSVVPVNDFRSNRRMRMGGYSILPGVGENGTYQPLTSPTDEEATYAITKRGGLESITLEMMANDDVGSVRRVPIALGRSAAITLYRFVFDFILNNGNTTYDATALFHSNHGNLGAAALDSVSLLAAKIRMADQAAYNEATDILGLVPKYLLIPNELEDTAHRLTQSRNAIAVQTPPLRQGDNEPNLHSTYGLTPLLVPYWTDVDDWALVCDPAECPTIEIGFFQGREEPQIFVQDQPNVGSMFTADKITYKIKHTYGGEVIDHRGMQKDVVT